MKEFRPTLEKVMTDLHNFPHEIQMYVYHKLSGRDQEAETYLETYKTEQKQMKSELVDNNNEE